MALKLLLGYTCWYGAHCVKPYGRVDCAIGNSFNPVSPTLPLAPFLEGESL